jgi:hypothetical protein
MNVTKRNRLDDLKSTRRDAFADTETTGALTKQSARAFLNVFSCASLQQVVNLNIQSMQIGS